MCEWRRREGVGGLTVVAVQIEKDEKEHRCSCWPLTGPPSILFRPVGFAVVLCWFWVAFDIVYLPFCHGRIFCSFLFSSFLTQVTLSKEGMF